MMIDGLLILQEREKSSRKEPVMKKILRIEKGVKVRRVRVKETWELSLNPISVDIKAEFKH